MTIRYKFAPFLTRAAFGCHPQTINYPTSTQHLRGIVMLQANHAVQALKYTDSCGFRWGTDLPSIPIQEAAGGTVGRREVVVF